MTDPQRRLKQTIKGTRALFRGSQLVIRPRFYERINVLKRMK